ncbi:MAG: carboxypeptidase-like regulatory domain-containing protein [Gemmatimonadales bacterium]|nr:carboxypeptidase-like regulatory domain-containing protein [Gemmatimonadales bacterium]
MKRSAIVVAAFAGLLVGCRVDSVAPPTGGLGRFIVRGTVTNLAGTVNLANVTVQLQPLGGGPAVRTMLTDASGTYRTFGLAAGLYRVVVVMGDSSRITTVGIDRPPGLREPVTVGQTDSVVVPVLAYDPGKAISGSLTHFVQDTLRSLSVPFRNVKVWLFNSTRTTKLDSLRTSASGAIRFAVRPGTYYLRVDTASAEYKSVAVPAVIPTTALLDTLRVTASAPTATSNSATSTASGSLTYRAPYQIRARIFKDRCTPQPCTPDGVYRAVATDPDTIVSGVRIWLRRVGSTTNLGSGTVTSSTSTSATGNISFTSLDNAGDRWGLHVILWYLPAGCTIAATLTPEGDVQVTGDLAGGTVPLNNIPLTCP